jgi:exonuclease SbcC
VRPLSVELSGFRSFREPTRIDLSEVTAAALVGENGAGKTSIVEAIGWAFYGTGRQGKSPDEYVSTGAGECRVVVEFELAGQRYRVERQRSMAGGGKSSLHLQRWEEEYAS